MRREEEIDSRPQPMRVRLEEENAPRLKSPAKSGFLKKSLGRDSQKRRS